MAILFNDASGKIITAVVVTCGKFATSVNDTNGKCSDSQDILPPVSTTLLINSLCCHWTGLSYSSQCCPCTCLCVPVQQHPVICQEVSGRQQLCCTWTCLPMKTCAAPAVQCTMYMSVYKSFRAVPGRVVLPHLDVSVYKSLCCTCIRVLNFCAAPLVVSV
jgi:hypothetical protein